MTQTHTLIRQTAFATFALIILCVLWEGILAPLHPWQAGFPWMSLKGLLLAPLLPRLWRGERRGFQIMTLLILLYFTEGVVRAFSDISLTSRLLAHGEWILSLLIFIGANKVAYRLRPAAPHVDAASNQHKSRPKGRVQLLMYLYATGLIFTAMTYLYTPDGTESTQFAWVVAAVRYVFLILNIALVGLWLYQGHIRATHSKAPTP